MTTLYKLTNSSNESARHTKWGNGVSNIATGAGTRLCSSDVIHAYRSQYLAVIMNVEHAGFEPARLWLAEGTVVADDGTKVGVKELTTLKRMRLPRLRQDDLVEFGLRASLLIPQTEEYTDWANAKLSGEKLANIPWPTDSVAYSARLLTEIYTRGHIWTNSVASVVLALRDHVGANSELSLQIASLCDEVFER